MTKAKTKNNKLSKEKLCSIFCKSRQGYYYKQKSSKYLSDKYKKIMDCITKYKRIMPYIGGRKLHYKLNNCDGIKIGRDTIFNILRDNALLVRRKKRYAKTTNSKHWYKKYPDIVKTIKISHSEQLLVCDITYTRTKEGFCYLSLVTDAYSKYILGYYLSKNLEAIGPELALKMALSKRRYNTICVHHSDRGIQYCCFNYIDLLNKNGLKISMTQTGSPYDNAIAERVNGILKEELSLNTVFENYSEAEIAVKQAIEIYNNHRPHLSCGYLTPNEAHIKGMGLEKAWKSYHNKHSKQYSR